MIILTGIFIGLYIFEKIRCKRLRKGIKAMGQINQAMYESLENERILRHIESISNQRSIKWDMEEC